MAQPPLWYGAARAAQDALPAGRNETRTFGCPASVMFSTFTTSWRRRISSAMRPFSRLQLRGSSRSGYEKGREPSIKHCGTVIAPLSLQDLVDSQFWNDRFYQPEEYEWQLTLFQPVGGMDMIWRKGFLAGSSRCGIDM